MLLVELRALARHPVVDEAPELRVAREVERHAMAVRALERDLVVTAADREHGHMAALAVGGAVVSQVHRASARRSRCASDAARVVGYNRRDRRGPVPRRLFAPEPCSAANPWKGLCRIECARTSSCISCPRPPTKSG